MKIALIILSIILLFAAVLGVVLHTFKSDSQKSSEQRVVVEGRPGVKEMRLSIRQIDSITSRANYTFTKANRVASR